MRTRLDKFNTLPPKPEHLKKVRRALAKVDSAQKVSDLVAQTGLSNTQVLCALDLMIRNGEVVKQYGSHSFVRTELLGTLD